MNPVIAVQPIVAVQPRWSATRLKTFLNCPRQFHYAYVAGIPAVPTSPLVFGRVLHQVLCFAHERQMAERKLPPVAQVLEQFDGLWSRALDEEQPFFRPGAPSPQMHTTLAHELLRAFLSAHQDKAPPLAVELAFEIEAAGHALCGVIDRVDEGQSGLIIVDFKSGARKPPLADVERDLQLTLYAFAAQKVLEQPVEQVVHYHLRNSSQIATQRGESEFEWLLDKVLPHVAQAVEREQFSPRYGYWCNWCDFRELCRAQDERDHAERNYPQPEPETAKGGEAWPTPHN